MRHKAAPTRRQLRQRRQRTVSLLLLAAMLAMPCVALRPWTAHAGTGATAVARIVPTWTSRGTGRETGVWTLGESDMPTDSPTIRAASNPVVETLINGRDADALPDGFDPDHATGDDGDRYPYGQCTWWAYERRHQLGLPVGGRFGDGGRWAASARALGYWVDGTPRQGDVAVFKPGVLGASGVYGHVAVVEAVGSDGSITISEANVGGRVGPFQRTIPAGQTGLLEYIHY